MDPFPKNYQMEQNIISLVGSKLLLSDKNHIRRFETILRLQTLNLKTKYKTIYLITKRKTL